MHEVCLRPCRGLSSASSRTRKLTFACRLALNIATSSFKLTSFIAVDVRTRLDATLDTTLDDAALGFGLEEADDDEDDDEANFPAPRFGGCTPAAGFFNWTLNVTPWRRGLLVPPAGRLSENRGDGMLCVVGESGFFFVFKCPFFSGPLPAAAFPATLPAATLPALAPGALPARLSFHTCNLSLRLNAAAADNIVRPPQRRHGF